MGQSLSGRIGYGYLLGNEDELDEETTELIQGETWEEPLIIAAGGVSPYQGPDYDAMGRYPKSEVYEAWRDAHKSEIDAWYAVSQRVIDSLGPVEFCFGGITDSSYNEFALLIKDSGAHMYDGAKFLGELDTSVPEDQSWDDYLTTFADTIGLDLSGASGPGWVLLVSYG